MPLIHKNPQPFWTTLDGAAVVIHQADVLEGLGRLGSGSVQCAVTSPPYWGLRDYGVAGQLGGERTPEEYVVRMTSVFRELRRVLRDDGTFWLNIGDTYANTSCGGESPDGARVSRSTDRERSDTMKRSRTETYGGLASGNLVGIPWRLALSLQADGWVLRQDIIWHKPSPMPESVTNRCTKSHEYLFLFTKRGSGYYYDAEAIKEESIHAGAVKTNRDGKNGRMGFGGETREGFVNREVEVPDNKNKRSVWTIASQPYPGAHFATFPTRLVEPCILAGTSERGCCPDCRAPYRRVLEKEQLRRARPNDYVKRKGEEGTGNSCANTVAGVDVRTIGWEPTCKHEHRGLTEPCTVLDPFLGSGTTAVVALRHGRKCVGIDLSAEYLADCAVPRIEGCLSELSLGYLSPGAVAAKAKAAASLRKAPSLLKTKRG